MSNPIFPYGVSSYIGLTEETGQWRPFVHFADNLIHELMLPNVFDFDSFTDITCAGPTPMPNSPIAVCAWSSQVHVYYFTNNSTVQDIFFQQGATNGFILGANLGPVMRGSVTLYATADADTSGQIRVGYQSPSDPTTITESVYTVSSGWTTRSYPKMMF